MENPDNKSWELLTIKDISYYTQLYPNAESSILQAPAPGMPPAPAAMPPPVPVLPLVINITQQTDPASKFIKDVKQLLDDFLAHKKDGQWQEWKKSMTIMAKAQLVSKVLDGTYVPDVVDITLFGHKQTYMLAVFKKNC